MKGQYLQGDSVLNSPAKIKSSSMHVVFSHFWLHHCILAGHWAGAVVEFWTVGIMKRTNFFSNLCFVSHLMYFSKFGLPCLSVCHQKAMVACASDGWFNLIQQTASVFMKAAGVGSSCFTDSRTFCSLSWERRAEILVAGHLSQKGVLSSQGSKQIQFSETKPMFKLPLKKKSDWPPLCGFFPIRMLFLGLKNKIKSQVMEAEKGYCLCNCSLK